MRISEIYALPDQGTSEWFDATVETIEDVMNVGYRSDLSRDMEIPDRGRLMVHRKLGHSYDGGERWVSIDSLVFDGIPFALRLRDDDRSHEFVTDAKVHTAARGYLLGRVHHQEQVDTIDPDRDFIDGYGQAAISRSGGDVLLVDASQVAEDGTLVLDERLIDRRFSALDGERFSAMLLDAVPRYQKFSFDDGDRIGVVTHADGHAFVVSAKKDASEWRRDISVDRIGPESLYEVARQYFTGSGLGKNIAFIDPFVEKFHLSRDEALDVVIDCLKGGRGILEGIARTTLRNEGLDGDSMAVSMVAVAQMVVEDESLLPYAKNGYPTVKQATELLERLPSARPSSPKI